MGKWEMVRLGDLGLFQTGGTPSRNKPDFFKGTHPWITTPALGATYIDASNANAFLTDEAINSSATKIIPDNSLMVGIRVGVGKSSINSVPMCTNQDIVSISNVDDSEVLLEYLHKYITTQQEYLNNQKRGATIQGIKTDVLKELMIPLPPLPIQQEIATVLDKASALIEKRKAQIEKLDLLAKAQFMEMFGDPVTNPKGWGVKQLSEIATSRLGKMLDAKQQTGKYKYPYLANFNVQWFKFNLNTLNEMDFIEEEQMEFALEKGDLLICEGGEVGRCAIWKDDIKPCFFQKALHRVKCDKNIILPEYLAWWFYLMSKYNQFADVIGQATIAHLPGVKLKQLRIMVPSIDLQDQFATFVQQVEAQKTILQQSLAQLELNYKSLMQKCFRGEVF